MPTFFHRYRKHFAFLVLIIGALVIWRQYDGRQRRVTVKVRHRFHGFGQQMLTGGHCRLDITVQDKSGDQVWHGEYRVRERRLSHGIELLKGSYRGIFSLRDCGPRQTVEHAFSIPSEPISLRWESGQARREPSVPGRSAPPRDPAPGTGSGL